MDTFIFVYNIILLVLFSVALTISFSFYFQKRQPVYLVMGLLYFIYILDNTIIYMTEFIDSFSTSYNRTFMVVPAIKTVIILSYSFCNLYLLFYMLKRKISIREQIILILFGIFLLFVPILQGGAFMVWLFYLPAQIYLFYLASGGLYYMKNNEQELEEAFCQGLKKFLICNVIFAVLIVMEDTIVIFNFDVYSNLVIKINNRNYSEDVLSIIYAICTLLFLHKIPIWEKEAEVSNTNLEGMVLLDDSLGRIVDDKIVRSVQEEPDRTKEPEEIKESDKIEESEEAKAYENGEGVILLQFCQEYQLTFRETEILKYLLEDMNNQEICEACHISIGTVKTHVHNIFMKADVAKRSQLIRCYQEFEKLNKK